MAALAGVIGATAEPPARSRVERMLSAQAHRGALRSLARAEIAPSVGVDLGCLYRSSSSGEDARPLARHGGHTLAYDGWISNAAELRRALLLEHVPVSEASPAELLLQALIRWGKGALSRCQGSWALVFVDSTSHRIWLARDPLGGRPLYYFPGAAGGLFASEIKGILSGTGDRFAVDAGVVSDFLEQTILDARPQTFFSGIQAVPAGHLVSLDCARPPPWNPEPAAFWRIPERDEFAGSEAARIEAVREHLVSAVRRQLSGAGRIGLLVSGGVDSSSVAAIACALPGGSDLLLISGTSEGARRPDPMLDALCRHLRRETQRFSMSIPAERALDDLETVIGCNDEPVRGFDIAAEYRLKQRASELGATLLMGGLGSDELFSGKLVHLVFYVQSLLRSGRLLEAARVMAGVVRRGTIRPRFRVAVQKRYFPSLDRKPIDVRGPRLAAQQRRHDLGLGPGSCHERLLREITCLSLPALLHSDDRISMAFGIENRYAFLDPPLVELVAPMAPGWKLRDGYPKWLLRKAMESRLPREIAWRKVTQSGRDAYGDWLKNDLHTPIQRLIDGELASVELGLLDRNALRRHYAAFCGQGADSGAISAHDVFHWIAIELWARRFEPHLRGDRP